MSGYSAMSNMVNKMFTRHVATAQLKVLQLGSYDVSTSEIVSNEVLYDVSIINVNIPSKMSGKMTEYGTLIDSTVSRIFMLPQQNTPTPLPERDMVVIKGKDYSIVSLKEVNPSGNNSLIYDVYLKR